MADRADGKVTPVLKVEPTRIVTITSVTAHHAGMVWDALGVGARIETIVRAKSS